MNISIDEIARVLGQGEETRLAGNGWKTRCPAHEDKTASLGIHESNGKILVRCHAGCTNEAVIEALRNLDLWPKASSRKATWNPISPVPDSADMPNDVKHSKHGRPKKHWTYKDFDGKLVGFVYRFEDDKGNKTTIPLSYCKNDEGERMWMWKSFDKPRPLYGLDRLAKFPDKPVAVFEGEKACDAARQLFGEKYVCISWPGGSNAVKHTDWKPLSSRKVVLWPDNDDAGRKAMELLAEILIAESCPEVRMVIPPPGLDKGWDVADELPVELNLDLHKLIEQARVFEPTGDKIINQFNKRFALVLAGGRATIIRESFDADENKTSIDYISPDAFRIFHSNAQVQVGRTEVPVGQYWLQHEDRRSFEGIVFVPGRQTPGRYNLWRGFSHEADPAGDWSMFKDHLFNNACNGDQKLYDWVFGWFANIVQYPWKKTGTSLSFRGDQGTGKTIIGKIMGALMQQHYTLVDDSRYIFGNFNQHMASTLLLHLDEAFWGGNPKHVGKLRSLVTSETHFIEHKGRDSVQVDNYMRLLITTNQYWVIPAGFEERRFAVIDMTNRSRQDRPYFIEMLRQMRDGGYGGLLYELQNFNTDLVDVAQVPATKALLDQKELSMTDVAKFWFNCLMEGEIFPGKNLGWPKDVMNDPFYEIFVDTLEKWGIRYRPTHNEFFKELRRYAPPESLRKIRLSNKSGTRPWGTALPDLKTAREFFDSLNMSKFDWPPIDNEPITKSGFSSEEIPF